MSNLPSKPFGSGTEYEAYIYNNCLRCRRYVVRDDGFPALPENGGCEILDAMEYARFDISKFPSDKVRELRDVDGNILSWHYCLRFHSVKGQEDQNKHFEKLRDAILKKKVK